jgi:hypothetical protein
MALVEVALKSRFFRRSSRVILGGPEQKLCLEVNSLNAVVSDSR